jgi:hypothetical protein
MKIKKYCAIIFATIAMTVNTLFIANSVSAKIPRILISHSPSLTPRTKIVGTRLRGFLKTKYQHGQSRKALRGIPAREILQAVREGKIDNKNRQYGDDGRRRVKYVGGKATVITQNGKIVTSFWNGSTKNQKKKNADQSARENRPIPFPKK